MKYELPIREPDFDIHKIDVYPLLSEGMRKVVDYQIANSKDAFDTNCTWDDLRTKYVQERRFWNEGGPQPYAVKEITVAGPEGDVPVRVYYPDDKPAHHAVFFIHGGGFTVGNNDTHDRMMRCVMESSGCAVIGIDYRLSPEFKFPVALFECVSVVEYFREHGADYGILPDKMALCGDSGGANLSMAVNLFLRDTTGNDFICALLLFYGSYGMSDSVSSRLQGTALDGMRRKDLASYRQYYISEGEEENPYYAVFYNDLSKGVPPTYMCCGDLDPLLDDSILLQKLQERHGIHSKLDIFPGVLHAYMHYGCFMEETLQSFQNCGAFLREELEK